MTRPRDHAKVRRSYDSVASEYWGRIGDELTHKPLDRALLTALLEQTDGLGPVADLGCGPGHVTGWLADHGVRSVGIDLSPAMVGIARREHPRAEFRVGDLLRLPAEDGEFGAAVALYSVIHLEPSEMRAAFEEMRRVMRPSGRVLVAFHVGTEVRHLAEWWGLEVDVDFRFFETERVIGWLKDVGLTVEASLERTSHPREAETRRAYVMARRAD